MIRSAVQVRNEAQTGDLPEWLNGTVLKTVIRETVSGVRIPESPQNYYYMFLTYYVICIIYCFYQLNKRYKRSGTEYTSPEMDAIMVVVMAWVLAPVDVSLTWIKWYKDAEQARINQMKFDIDLKEDNID